jgi:ribonuclease HII
MKELDLKYPEYGFSRHKGYGTKEHLIALSKYGPIKGIHRYTFAPIKDFS